MCFLLYLRFLFFFLTEHTVTCKWMASYRWTLNQIESYWLNIISFKDSLKCSQTLKHIELKDNHCIKILVHNFDVDKQAYSINSLKVATAILKILTHIHPYSVRLWTTCSQLHCWLFQCASSNYQLWMEYIWCCLTAHCCSPLLLSIRNCKPSL